MVAGFRGERISVMDRLSTGFGDFDNFGISCWTGFVVMSFVVNVFRW